MLRHDGKIIAALLALGVLATAAVDAQESPTYAATDARATTAPVLWQQSMNIFRRFEVNRAGNMAGLVAFGAIHVDERDFLLVDRLFAFVVTDVRELIGGQGDDWAEGQRAEECSEFFHR